LPPAQAKIWCDTVNTTPAGWFAANDHLLECYCRHVHASNCLAKLIDARSPQLEEIKTLGRLLSMRERETRMISHLATKMRLTQQARMHPRSVGRAFEAAPPAKPWEFD
jgi:hypothetical protein